LRRVVSLWDERTCLDLLVNFGRIPTISGKNCDAAAGLVIGKTINIVLYQMDKIVLELSSDLAKALLYTRQVRDV
jgi:hypothetical protein